jgi:hypothetical protein
MGDKDFTAKAQRREDREGKRVGIVSARALANARRFFLMSFFAALCVLCAFAVNRSVAR